MTAIAIVMACGVALFVTLRSMHGYLREAQRSYYETYQFADVFARPRRAPDSVRPALAAIPGVARLDTRIVVDVQLAVPGLPEPATGRLISFPVPDGPRVNRLFLRRGRLLEMRDVEAVLVNDAFAQANALGVGSQVRAALNGRWRSLRVAGIVLSPEFVYAVRPGEVFPDNRHFGIIWMAAPALAAAVDMTGAFSDVAMTLDEQASRAEVLAAVDRVLERFGGAGAYGREDQVSHRFLSDEIAETQVTSLLLPGIFLAVTAFLLNLVFGRLVTTQRRQIGVLKAFGYRNGQVALHYLELAAVPILAGGVAGALLGQYLARLMAVVYTRFFEFPMFAYRADWSVVATALAITAVAAIVGVARAVRAAVSLHPAAAMQPPAPPTFVRGAIEQLGGCLRVSVPWRITLRNIERRRGRSSLAVAATACAVALVVASWFLFDAVQRARDTHFYVVQRDAVMVVFEDVRSAQARQDLARLPGVRRVEAFRAAPARIRHGASVRRTTAVGLPLHGELHRIADRRGVVHPLARGELLITSYLANGIGAGAGDTVTVEVLEGSRPVREFRVAGLVDEVLGTSAYLDIQSLNDVLQEGRAVSGAFLAVDADQLAPLYQRLRGIPSISGVSVRRTMMASFDRTFAESFAIPIRMLVVFACVIAAGIVYNGISVALSERSHELATLRVLGFSHREVAGMLIGEQRLLTVLGLPVGFGLGFLLSSIIVARFETEMFRLPLAIEAATYLRAAGVIAVASAAAALLVRRKLARLDLIDALKSRE